VVGVDAAALAEGVVHEAGGAAVVPPILRTVVGRAALGRDDGGGDHRALANAGRTVAALAPAQSLTVERNATSTATAARPALDPFTHARVHQESPRLLRGYDTEGVSLYHRPMLQRSHRTLSVALLCAMLAAPAVAAPPGGTSAPDKSVIKALKKMKMVYEVDADQDFKVVFDLGSGRTQLVIVRSAVEHYGSLAIREVMSAAWSSPEPPDAELLTKILADNTSKKIGAWELHQGSQHTLVFTARVPAKLNHRQLLDAMEATMTTADDMERQISQGDEF
jgi:hypothetical protein